MNPIRIGKLLCRYESGSCSANEVANALLFDVVSQADIDPAFLASLQTLPDEVRGAFLQLLQTIEEAEFHWTPFLVPGPAAECDPLKLRRVCDMIAARTNTAVAPGPK